MGSVRISGTAVTGRGKASGHFGAIAEEVQAVLGEELVPGSLNLVSSRPIGLRSDTALKLQDGRRLIWPGLLDDGQSVWIYRYPTASLQALEVLCSRHLRNEYKISDGDSLSITVDSTHTLTLSLWRRAAWMAIWSGGRQPWVYTGEWYRRNIAKRFQARLGLTQVTSQ